MSPAWSDRLSSVLPQLSPAERRVATLLQDDPGRAARSTVTELAARTDTSTATVLRTAKRLGFAGYPALRYALATQAGREPAETDRSEGVPQVADVVAADDAETIVAKLAAYEAAQLASTAELVSPAALEAGAVALAGAARRYAFGLGASGLVAHDLVQKLNRLGLPAASATEHDAALVAASLLGPGDAVVAVSHGGESPGALEPARLARRGGADLTVITGSPRSSLARLADQVLLTAGAERGPRSAAVGSRTAQLLLVDALFVRVTQLIPTAGAALQTTHDVIAAARRRGR